MDEKEQEFDLEDIIKEFGGNAGESDEEPAVSEEEPAPPAEETAEKSVEEEPAEESSPICGDTIRIDPISPAEEPAAEEPPVAAGVPDGSVEAPSEEESDDEPTPADAMSGDTIRIEAIPDTQGAVRDAEHIDDEDEPMIPPEIPQKAEPYSDQWEPEYEQPMADYVPPKPIVFRPKQRLREIKKQLVEGPEKEYYRLAEKGFGKLQAAIFFSLLVVLLSAAATVMYAAGSLPPQRLKLMIFVQFMAMLLSALLGSFQLIDGFLAILKGRFNLNTLLLFTFGLCVADGILCFQQLRVPCCAAFSLQVSMALWSTYQTRNTRMGQLDTMRKASRLDGLFPVEREGKVYLVRGQGEVEHFNKTDKDTPGKETLLHVYALVALIVIAGAGVLAGILHGIHTAVQVASVTALAAMPASMLICVRRPMGVLERRLHKLGTVLCGWKGAKAMTGKRLFPIDHEDLFPQGTVKLNGVKFFGKREPDQIIAYATALVTREYGTLNPIFSQLLESRNGMHYDPKEFQFYDGGIGGVVNGEPVLVGTPELLRSMGVEVPEGIRVSQAVFVSVDGELCGLFAVTYELTRSAACGMATLCSYRKLQPVLVSRDFMLTPTFIREHFGVNPKKILFPEMEERYALSQLAPAEDSDPAALITGEGLSCFAFAVTGSRSLRAGVNLGIVIHLIGGILGMLIMLALAYMNATWLLTPANLFLYELVWLVPGVLITEWTRSV